MFEQRLPYGIWDADNHFPEPQDALPRYIDPKFRDKVAVDVIRRERDRLRAEAKAAGKDPEALMIDPDRLKPGATLNRLNPYKNLDPEAAQALIDEFKTLGDRISDPA